MRDSRKDSSIIVLALMLALCCSCSQEGHNQEVARRAMEMRADPALKEVSVTIALIAISIQEDKKINCMMARIFNKPSTPETAQSEQEGGDKEAVRRALKDFGEESKWLCDFYTRVESETSATFDEIKKRHCLLDRQYSFFIYTPTKNKEIGLFASEEKCNEFAQFAFDQGMPVRK